MIRRGDPDAMPPAANTSALRRLRVARGVKQAHLADVLGVRQATISRWERGQASPSEAQAVRLRRLLEARLDPAGDAALKRLVEGSRHRTHLICDATHRLLAASRPRQAEWRRDAAELLGAPLLRYASDEIRGAEAALAAVGWFQAASPAAVVWTGPNRSRELRIAPGACLWERLTLSGGSIARLVTNLTAAEIARERPDALLLAPPPS